MSNLLEIKNLRTTFSTMQGKADAIRGVDLQVKENEILEIVGESGSGKSVTMKSVMGLLPLRNRPLPYALKRKVQLSGLDFFITYTVFKLNLNGSI